MWLLFFAYSFLFEYSDFMLSPWAYFLAKPMVSPTAWSLFKSTLAHSNNKSPNFQLCSSRPSAATQLWRSFSTWLKLSRKTDQQQPLQCFTKPMFLVWTYRTCTSIMGNNVGPATYDQWIWANWEPSAEKKDTSALFIKRTNRHLVFWWHLVETAISKKWKAPPRTSADFPRSRTMAPLLGTSRRSRPCPFSRTFLRPRALRVSKCTCDTIKLVWTIYLHG